MRVSWRAAAVALLLFLVACVHLPSLPGLASEQAIAPANGSPLDLAIATLEERYPGQSAFRLVVEGNEAFVSRMQSARMAARSLDVQSYIWHADATGRFLAQELLLAADRGVRVRVLLDDLDARQHNVAIAALAAHPNIQVRLFNPFASRRGAVRFFVEAALSFKRINRRMHNKSWIADNRLAIVGGRNIGDEYFAASDEVNFIDLDFAMIGPVVRDASASFDRYWNSPVAYPIDVLNPKAVSRDAVDRYRERLIVHAQEAKQSRYAESLRADEAIQRMVSGEWPMEWATQFEFVSDDPRKVSMSKDELHKLHVGAALAPMIETAQQRLTIISPYFVPGGNVTTRLVDASRTGREIRVLTNSLVANDVAAVHGGYSRHRETLVAGGVRVWELKPSHGAEVDTSLLGSSGAALHTKAFVVDGRTLFVGSYNLDPRSTWLNCEQGVLVHNAVLAQQLERLFDRQTAGERAWRVSLEAGELQWTDGAERLHRDPYASLGRRVQAWLARFLRLDAQL
ncbi:MAG TPA: phospholipase D family protein [Steroidobacter sp.]|uniref:phospholipase D family protein n=1 Tax=Steroidobacter sp. TaxID=1978227 RepID=UPI002ED95D8A